jgi:hypothetical protein
MATVVEEYLIEEQRTVVRFYGQKDSMKMIHIKNNSCLGRKCLSPKAVHNWVQRFSKGSSKVADGLACNTMHDCLKFG